MNKRYFEILRKDIIRSNPNIVLLQLTQVKNDNLFKVVYIRKNAYFKTLKANITNYRTKPK